MHVIRLVEACRTDGMELLNDSTLILIAKNPGAAHPRDFLFFFTGATAGLHQPEQLYRNKEPGILEGREKQGT
jgi:hypothetical protein